MATSPPAKDRNLPARPAAIVGEIVPNEANAAAALTTIVSSLREAFVVAKQEKTERLRIRARLEERRLEIESAERDLVTYFNHVFPERRDSLNRLFTELDRAREAGQTDVMAASIQGIVDVATTSPLKGAFDLALVRRELAARRVEL